MCKFFQQQSGGCVLGFRVEAADQLHLLHTQIKNLQNVYSQSPIFGVEYKVEHKLEAVVTAKKVEKIEDDVEIVKEEGFDPSLLYQHVDDEKDFQSGYHDIVYNTELGLAVEKLPGQNPPSVTDLWFVF